ncbi:hypothetical protein CGQ24_07355 [Arthrobacter sp. 7749]|nr:hypothetical protein CGQ24_07355 [Arthrobacter sp. 7749]
MTYDFPKPHRIPTVDKNGFFPPPLEARLAAPLLTKADLVSGKVPVGQLPTDALVSDSNVAAQVNSPVTAAAIDGRIATQVEPVVDQLVAEAIADDGTIVAAAAAAVDANPKIALLESGKLDRTAMPGTADFNTYVTPAKISVSTSSNKTNIPVAFSGSLDVSTTGSIVVQKYVTGEGIPRTWTRRLNAGTWGVWRVETAYAPAPAGGVDFDTILDPSVYPINLGTHPNQPAATTGTLEVLPLGTNLVQRFTTNDLVPRIFLRRKTSTVWQAWAQPNGAEITGLTGRVTNLENAAPPAASGESTTKYGHTVRLARAKQLVGVRKSPRAQVALVCDHGTVKFRDLVYPKLQALGLTATLALNSQKVAGGSMHDPALEVSTWDQVKTWTTAGIEIANHGRTHLDTDSLATLYAEIVTGHEELESALGKPVHSWVQPSAAGDLGKWFGFNDGISWDSWSNTDAGRMILDRHAVATGTIYPIGTYQLTGEPPIGMQGHWFDRDDQIEPLKTKIVAAEAEKSGILLRMHPQYIGGQNTIESINGFLEWLAAEKAAGRIDVVTLTQWALTRIES